MLLSFPSNINILFYLYFSDQKLILMALFLDTVTALDKADIMCKI